MKDQWYQAAQVYLAVAHYFRRVDLELHDTIKDRDVDVSTDVFAGLPKPESKDIQVKVIQECKRKSTKVYMEEYVCSSTTL